MSRRSSGGDGLDGLVFIILGIIAMPIVGICMLSQQDPDKKALGAILLIIGIVLWVVAFK